MPQPAGEPSTRQNGRVNGNSLSLNSGTSDSSEDSETMRELQFTKIKSNVMLCEEFLVANNLVLDTICLLPSSSYLSSNSTS